MGAAALTLEITVTTIAQINGVCALRRRVSIPRPALLSPLIVFYADHHAAGGLLPLYPQHTSQLEGSLHRCSSGGSYCSSSTTCSHFLYVQRVVDTRSLYGSVGIIVVLMLGLYVFWLLILLGGQSHLRRAKRRLL